MPQYEHIRRERQQVYLFSIENKQMEVYYLRIRCVSKFNMYLSNT